MSWDLRWRDSERTNIDVKNFALTRLWMYKYWSIQCNVKRFVLTRLWTHEYWCQEFCVDETSNVQILVHSMWCQEICEDLHRRDFERANIGSFKVMSRDLWKFASTRLWTCKYWSIQCDVKRFVKICIDETLNVQILVHSKWCQEICIDKILNVRILVHSMWCQEICEDLHWQDFERTNIGLFNAMSRDLKICIDKTLNVRILVYSMWRQEICEICIDKTLNVQILVYSIWCREICIDKTLNVRILVHSMWCQEICEDLHWQDFECTNIGPFNVMSRDLWRFALTRLWMYEYWSIQCDVKRFALIRLWRSNIGQFNAMSRDLYWQDFERSNIGPFNVMSRDLRRFASTGLWTYEYWSIRCDVKRSVKICIDETLNVWILVHSMQCQEICGDLHWRDFEHTNIDPFNVMPRDLYWQDFECANIDLFNVVSRDL